MKNRFVRFVIGLFMLFLVMVSVHAQDAKPAPAAKESVAVAPADTTKPPIVPIKSEADQLHIQLLNTKFSLNSERQATLNRERADLQQEALTLIKKMASDLSIDLNEYELDPQNPLQFVLIKK